MKWQSPKQARDVGGQSVPQGIITLTEKDGAAVRIGCSISGLLQWVQCVVDCLYIHLRAARKWKTTVKEQRTKDRIPFGRE